uniref:pseudouridine-5'-phosphate glycosidase isoform X2 n=1 Tax=Erigeron canadensis TaxID=72917 RepID=UPI001CB9CBBB|nr:pseudouridine-5'-phosphate glycosidase isoform X2 [Erigeron canadensis]
MASNALSRLANLHRHFHITRSSTKGGHDNANVGTIKISQDVSTALANGKAVVALESTIISHGMPYPQNMETAKEVEAIVRDNGAVPATIAILDGIPCIGLSTDELERLAKLGTQARKISRRDIAHVVATRGSGGTTVSATMFFASMVGISIFVTGGIGGVHKHGESTLDISSDLTELGRNAMTVVSAGVKSILDIPKTLEYLETQGVSVVSYQTDDFPAFFTEKSGCKAPCQLDSPEDCARMIEVNRKLDLKTGILIAIPIPKEHSVSGNIIESAIQTALREAADKGITGSAETPYLLSRVNELTGGASLESSIL